MSVFERIPPLSIDEYIFYRRKTGSLIWSSPEANANLGGAVSFNHPDFELLKRTIVKCLFSKSVEVGLLVLPSMRVIHLQIIPEKIKYQKGDV